MSEDDLVGWYPGGEGEPGPGTQEKFGKLFVAWAHSGAHCPVA